MKDNFTLEECREIVGFAFGVFAQKLKDNYPDEALAEQISSSIALAILSRTTPREGTTAHEVFSVIDPIVEGEITAKEVAQKMIQRSMFGEKKNSG